MRRRRGSTGRPAPPRLYHAANTATTNTSAAAAPIATKALAGNAAVDPVVPEPSILVLLGEIIPSVWVKEGGMVVDAPLSLGMAFVDKGPRGAREGVWMVVEPPGDAPAGYVTFIGTGTRAVPLEVVCFKVALVPPGFKDEDVAVVVV